MKEAECIPYRDTGYFSSLILDYINQDPKIQDYISHFPSLKAFADGMQSRANFPASKRELLVDTINKQYRDSKTEISDAVAENLKRLKSDSCFTVTTGHQLNILTGPLFFIYKILGTIKLSAQLKEAYPDKEFVPVYWMASEDHDFEEISFINLFGGKLRWVNDLKGAVGPMPTFGFGKVLDELEEHLGPGAQAEELMRIFREAYHQRDNLSDATRYIVNALFGKYGLLVLDANDANLKREMIPHFKEDLFTDTIYRKVKEQSGKLEGQYFSQVNPREINLFYLSPGSRERIEKQGDKWRVLNTNISFNADGLKEELEKHPERFSPNVVLRPLYQECILPNLAYIGGGGELAYWFQLKSMFDAREQPFPLLILRNSVLLVPEKWQNRLNDLELPLVDLFKDLVRLKADFIKARFPEDAELNRFDAHLEVMFSELEAIANLTDKSMLGAVNAQRQKQLTGIEKLRKKLIRAEKRRSTEQMEKIERVYYALFPKGGLQERHDNISTYYAAYGAHLLEKIYQQLDPLDFRFTLIRL